MITLRRGSVPEADTNDPSNRLGLYSPLKISVEINRSFLMSIF